MITTSFAEYHSKRNPLERVHAAEEKQLQKHGPFHVHDQEADTDEHKAAIAMEALASELGGVLSKHLLVGNIFKWCAVLDQKKTSFSRMEKTKQISQN